MLWRCPSPVAHGSASYISSVACVPALGARGAPSARLSSGLSGLPRERKCNRDTSHGGLASCVGHPCRRRGLGETTLPGAKKANSVGLRLLTSHQARSIRTSCVANKYHTPYCTCFVLCCGMPRCARCFPCRGTVTTACTACWLPGSPCCHHGLPWSAAAARSPNRTT